MDDTNNNDCLRLVKDVESLLKNNLSNDEIIKDVKTTRLTKPGDNYGSLMLRLDVHLKNTKSNKERDIFLVAKTLQESEVFQKIFNVQTTFKNEISLYTIAFPQLDKFLKSVNKDLSVDFVPKCYGGRINLENNKVVVDDNACLMLENAKMLGYTTLPKDVGFNLESTEYALEALAKLHASSLAFKQKDPESFEKYVKPHLSDFCMSDDMSNAAGIMLEKVMTKFEFSSEVQQKAVATYKRNLDRNVSKLAREPWSCILHNDSWINNILIRLDEKQKPQNVLLVDFQVCEYKSPVRDVIFFLFTSVQVKVLKQHMDTFLKYYFVKFTEFLEKLMVGLDDFSWENYLEELRVAAGDNEFSHILMMLQPIHREAIAEVNDADFRKTAENLYPFPNGVHLDKMLFCIEEFERRRWLYV